MRTPWSPLALLLFLPAQAPAARLAQEPKPARVRIADRCRAALAELHARSDFPGGSLALILPDGSEVELSVGVSSIEEKRAMQPADRMCAGSIGKTFVAAAMLRLAQQGKLDLDDKIAKHLGEREWFARLPNAETITIRQLLRHTSGIPRYVFKRTFWQDLLENPDKEWRPAELVGYVLGDRARFEAGKGWAYADTNYIVAGMILEKAAGESMYDYVRTHFLAPHRLDRTVAQDGREIPGLVQGYTGGLMQRFGMPQRVLEKGKFVFNPQFEWCGGGFVSTPRDLARWARVLWSGKAFAGPYLESVLETTPAERYFGPGSGYGLGVIVRKTAAGASLGHDGVFPGYASTMAWFPQAKIAAAFQINRDDARETKVRMHRELVRFVEIAKKELE